MADLYILPQTTYRAPSPQGRGRARELNTIIEDDQEDDVSPIRSPFLRKTIAKARDRTQDRDKIQAWLAPLEPVFSDDVLTPKGFPTPRGRHFMTAPTLPSSPSTASFSGEEVSSQGSSYKGDSWQRSSVMTDVTEFDDLYGVSDQESEPEVNKRRSSRKSRHSTTHFDEARKSLPQLHIPNESHLDSVVWSPEPASLKKKNITSPVPPTPPSAVAMSPAMLSFMKAQHAQIIPTISAPPSLDGSLDGSLTSEQLAALTAPTTPVMAGEDPQDSGDWAGVQLQPGAMETLQALSGAESGGEEMQQRHRHDQIIEVPAPPMAEARPTRPRLLTSNISRTSFILSPAQQRSSQDLTKLEIPSPGGFFSGLSPRSRSTWHYGTSPAEDIIPPTSTTAEQFYRVPWSREDAPPVPSLPQGHRQPSIITSGDYSDDPVEQVIEMLDTIKEEEVLTAMRIKSPVTAIRVPQVNTTSAGIAEQILSPLSPRDDVAVTEIVVDYDPEYARKQQEIANSHIDRTEVWLRAQFAYLRGVGFEPSEAEADVDPEKAKVKTIEESSTSGEETERAPTPPPKDGEQAKPASGLTRKKTVRFTNQVTSGSPVEPKMPCDLPSKLLKQESTYYRAFQSMTVKATQSDTFVSRSPRFEALQSQRISLREQHRAQLLGKYQLSVVPQSAKKRMSANVARGDDIIFEDPEKMRAEKEAEALKQMATANWHVAATKMLNGGRLVCAPVHKRLARLSLAPGAAAGPKRLRILDLGGQSTCDWAWHAAHQYPNSKVYTVTTKAIRQLSNANVRGPPNHRQVAVASLAKLPFDNDQFDLVSARELHSILKNSDVVDAEDEWDACLREIMRVLKPGGYIDFSVMDSDIVNAGPLGLAKSVEFGFTLKTLGYDPSPTKSLVSRLDRAGFEGVRRGWVMLPLGPKPVEKPAPVRYAPVNITQTSSPAPTASEPTSQQEQEQFGSTDNAAAVAGVAGTWSWERWILRCEMEKAAGEVHSGFKLADTVSTDGGVMKEAGKSLDGVAAVISEGRACGAGLRLLKGFARKPERRSQDLDDLMGTIDMMLDF